jgi:hypothetical protein|mmetsp:Transcript_108302/g.170796  ORF Transcript_108302/g.170796 Transcript_108302/m.170796 type:complete len:368 (-) Transcript_108302:43-1146(-)
MFLIVAVLSLLCSAYGQSHGKEHNGNLSITGIVRSEQRQSFPNKPVSFLSNEASLAAGRDRECHPNQAFYVTTVEGLMICDVGPVTMSGKTECRTLNGLTKTPYRDYVEGAPIETGMHTISALDNVGSWTLLVDGLGNQVYISAGCQNDKFDKVRILRFTKASNYKTLDLHIETQHPCMDLFTEGDFVLNQDNDIVFIEKGPQTGSGMTQVQKWKADNGGYQDANAMVTITAMPPSASTNQDGGWTFLMDGENNLLAVRTPRDDSCTVMVRRLTFGSDYNHIDTMLGYHGDGGTIYASFKCNPSNHHVAVLDPHDNILLINEGPDTKWGTMEFYIMYKLNLYHDVEHLNDRSSAPCRLPTYVDNPAL